MAATEGHLSVQMIDGNGVPKSEDFIFQTSTGLFLDTFNWAQQLAPILDAVTQSQIQKLDLVYPLVLPGGLKSAPVALSNNEIGALINYRIASEGDTLGQWTPNWIPAGYLAEFPALVWQDDAGPVAAFLAFMLGTAHSTIITDQFSQPLTSVKSAIKSVRKQRRALGRIR